MSIHAFASPSHRNQLTKYPVLATVEQRTQVRKVYVVLGSVLLVTLFHFVNFLAAPVSNLIGWGVPAYLSFKALESAGHQDDVQWLTYWVIFGFFNFLESMALGMMLFYVPWYYVLKSLFFLWLQVPACKVCPYACLSRLCSLIPLQGAHLTYVSVLKPLMSKACDSSRGTVRTDTNPDLRDRVNTATSE